MKNILDIKNLFMIVAMESEEKAFLEKKEFTTQTIGVKTQFVLKSLSLPQCTLTLARSGVGLGNAALLLAFAAEKIEIDAVVLLGVGGALDEKLDVGDAVISKQVLQHDSISTFENERVFIAPGELTLSASEDQQVNPFMKCDPVLVQWMKKSIEKTAVGKTYCGTMLSGGEFVVSTQRKKELRSLHPEA